MKLVRVLLAGLAVTVVVAVAYVQKENEAPADKMMKAAQNFVSTLTPEQRKQAQFDFEDEERTNWHFIPMQDENKVPTRKGVIIKGMTEKQKKAAMALLRTGTSTSGFKQARMVMELESILDQLEKNGRNVRDSEWYFVSIFGKPSRTGKWGWRIEGHHLSLNFTLDKGKIVSATPNFYGANPATVTQGPKKGQKTLAVSVKLARQLLNSLDAEQKKVAVQDKMFPEVEQGKAKPNVGEPVGLAAAKMTKKQKDQLRKLLLSYAGRMPKVVGDREMKKVDDAGFDKVHFAFAVSKAKGNPYTYRVQGPTFVIEFLNEQPDPLGTPANHIHSSWRNLSGDFGTGE